MNLNLIRHQPDTNAVPVVGVLNHVLHIGRVLSFYGNLLLDDIWKTGEDFLYRLIEEVQGLLTVFVDDFHPVELLLFILCHRVAFLRH